MTHEILPERQAQLVVVLADYQEPAPVAMLARVMGHKHGVSRSVAYDLLGPLGRKGLVRLTYDRQGFAQLTEEGRAIAS